VSYVIDASALVAALVDSGHNGDWVTSTILMRPLAVPELAFVESSNTLRRLELSGSVSRLEATAAHRDLLQLKLEIYPFSPFADRIWELRFNLTSYDAWYVALAEALNWPLLTLDHRIGRAGGPRCEILVPPPQP